MFRVYHVPRIYAPLSRRSNKISKIRRFSCCKTANIHLHLAHIVAYLADFCPASRAYRCVSRGFRQRFARKNSVGFPSATRDDRHFASATARTGNFPARSRGFLASRDRAPCGILETLVRAPPAVPETLARVPCGGLEIRDRAPPVLGAFPAIALRYSFPCVPAVLPTLPSFFPVDRCFEYIKR